MTNILGRPVGRRAVLRLIGGAGAAAAAGGMGSGVALAQPVPDPGPAPVDALAVPVPDGPGVLAPLSDLRGVQPPSQLNVTCPGGGRLQAWWDAGASPATGLRYQVVLDGQVVATTAAGSYTVGGLTVGTPHTIAVVATDDTGATSLPTAAVQRTVLAGADSDQAGVPAAVTAVAGLRGALLRWSHPAASVGGAPAQYRVFRAGTDQPVVTLSGTGGEAPATSCFVTGATPGVAQQYRVESYDAGGRRLGEARNRVWVTSYTRAQTYDYDPPSVPPPPRVVWRNRALDISWAPSSDGGTGVRGYEVHLNGRYVRTVVGATSCTVADLPPLSFWFVTVVAFDQAGNRSAPSGWALGLPIWWGPTATNPPAPPAFTVARDASLRDPSGAPFVPVGANVPGSDFFWPDVVQGASAAAADRWRFTAVRANCGMRDWGSVGGGYLYQQNNLVLDVAAEYSRRGVVTMLAQHARGTAPSNVNLPIGAGSAPDGTGRSVEQGVTDWWVELAKVAADDPYLWLNLVNEPGTDLAELDGQYRRMLSRIRSVAPLSTVVLDATDYANDIPADARIGRGPVERSQSFTLWNGPSLVRDWGPATGYGPVVMSVHLYSRWPGNYGGQGLITDAELAARIRDYLARARLAGVPVLVGEIGVEPAFVENDSASVRVGLYEQGRDPATGAATGVLVEQRAGVLGWHVSPYSGMALSRSGVGWDQVTSRSQTAPAPQAGAGIWDYAHTVRR